jgi:hypothetical protein
MLGILPKMATYSKKKKKKEKKDTSSTDEEPFSSKLDIKGYTDSDTDSDMDSEDDFEKDKEEVSVLTTLQNSEFLNEEEFLQLRKQRIERLIDLYHKEYKTLKSSLKRKYDQFLIERERVANTALLTE